jgi:hypothetical protein
MRYYSIITMNGYAPYEYVQTGGTVDAKSDATTRFERQPFSEANFGVAAV